MTDFDGPFGLGLWFSDTAAAHINTHDICTLKKSLEDANMSGRGTRILFPLAMKLPGLFLITQSTGPGSDTLKLKPIPRGYFPIKPKMII